MGQSGSLPSRENNREALRGRPQEIEENVENERVYNPRSRNLWDRLSSVTNMLGWSREKRRPNLRDERRTTASAVENIPERNPPWNNLASGRRQRRPSIRSLSPRSAPGLVRMRESLEPNLQDEDPSRLSAFQLAQREFERAERQFRSSIAALHGFSLNQTNQNAREEESTSMNVDQNVAALGNAVNSHDENSTHSPRNAEPSERSHTHIDDINMENYTRSVMNYLNMHENQPERAPAQNDGQLAMLSRFIFSVASGWVTVLMNSSTAHRENPLQTPVSSGERLNSGNETFEEFLTLLRSGELIEAMRPENNTHHEEIDEDVSSINLFRTFRFDSLHRNHEGQVVIPIIIVGIRSLRPNTNEEDDVQNQETQNLMHPSDFLSSMANDSQNMSSSSDQSNEFENLRTEQENAGQERVPANQPDLSNQQGAPISSLDDSDNHSHISAEHTQPRSWAIYVREAFLPENHPVLRAPSLFTDSPTYEDMLLLNSIIGTVKPPVALQKDVDRAGGIFSIVEPDDRCLVCLSDYEQGDECRRLLSCSHFFHRECIDKWLLSSQNSCPLCRAKGVASETIAF
ncbi:ubiquitin-protein ligase E3 [Schizosaccharomyces cryophilus OY26]|uniref:Ubiquitin-protein ligase E3 n=1 Tax=Schizosaccharomyces cryophilus (strain OY26 / ATCC MYA-4695 / CBS 11777 / NBRC 106824 / NRRL Y48691) TaxID=653667 RepID=S9W7E9_SCHCR|nr:ubiquitin-protein ligase E3 [Schizosaccharomyces cryophilus OY26]EPY53815.1 ubiquitin-protein ligase E3 [Schizosaccharomyces cryophilus OY26]